MVITKVVVMCCVMVVCWDGGDGGVLGWGDDVLGWGDGGVLGWVMVCWDGVMVVLG